MAHATKRSRKTSSARLSALEIATYGLLAAVALIFGYVEALFPLPVPVPGVKLGLGNVVVLYALASFGWRAGLLVMLVKVVASALLFGNPMVFAYSLAGGVASFAAMWAALRWWRTLSIVGVSMLGGVCHMLGQSAVVAAVLAPYVALTYLPVLMVSGLLAGLLTGYLCRLVIRATGRSSLFRRYRKELARAAAKQSSNPAPAAPPAGEEPAGAADQVPTGPSDPAPAKTPAGEEPAGEPSACAPGFSAACDAAGSATCENRAPGRALAASADGRSVGAVSSATCQNPTTEERP